MKASELIKHLKSLIEEKGDLPILIEKMNVCEEDYYEIECGIYMNEREHEYSIYTLKEGYPQGYNRTDGYDIEEVILPISSAFVIK
jgi:hypothetical protein